MGLSPDLELTCDNNNNIKSNSNNNNSISIDMSSKTTDAFLLPVVSMDDKKTIEKNDSLNVSAGEAEPEEGEIPNSDDDVVPNDAEYEAISSDEEYALRQKIQALEARNLELEKIHKISARSQVAYGYGAGNTLYGSYKRNSVPLFDDRHFNTSIKHRKLIFTPVLDAVSINLHKSTTRSRRCNLSDDDCVALSDNEIGKVFRESEKSYDRTYHRRSSPSSRRRKHHRERRHSDDERDATNRLRSKRRGCDIERVKRRRTKDLPSSSDDDCLEVTSREELKVALNINESTVNRSTLLHKLKAIHNKSGICSDQEDTAKKKSKKRSRHKSKSRASDDIHLVNGNDSRSELNDVIIVDDDNRENVDLVATEEGDGEELDEAISLEEQELRLIALKSAVMKKHEARKKRLLTSNRAYSPTDSLLTPVDEDTMGAEEVHDVDESVNNLDVIIDTEGNNNMDISPADSPESVNAACQPMDMDLVSSNDDVSHSPVMFTSMPNNIFQTHSKDNNQQHCMSVPYIHYGMPLVPNDGYNHMLTMSNCDSFAMATHPIAQLQLPTHLDQSTMVGGGGGDVSVPQINSEEECSLRERLIADLRSAENAKKKIGNAKDATITDDGYQDESLEADCLRSLLLSSIKKTRPNTVARPIESPNQSPENVKSSEIIRPTLDLTNLPKIASNLKEAVKRLQNKSKPNTNIESCEKPAKTNVPIPIDSATTNGVVETEKPISSSTEASNNVKKQTTPAPSPSSIEKKAQKVNVTPIAIGKKIATTTTPPTTAKTSKGTPMVVARLPPKKIEFPTKPVPVKIAPTKIQPPTVVNTQIARSSPISFPATSSISTLKIESTKKSTTPTINIPWKPVQKLIISLGADESSTTEYDDDDSDSQCGTNNNDRTNNYTDGFSAFDNASPASIAMDSPSMRPSSPIDGESSSSAIRDSAADENSSQTPDSFQTKLDEYLKQVRAKTEAASEIASTTKEKTKKKTIIVIPKSKTPLAVCHLPISAQLEYRRLIDRMKILERQKQQKASQLKPVSQNVPSVEGATTSGAYTNLRVTLKNTNRFIQSDENKPTAPNDSQPSVSAATTSPAPSGGIKRKPSLKKKVLLKNTLNAVVVAPDPSNDQTSATKETSSTNGQPIAKSAGNPIAGSKQIETFRQSEAKVNAYSETLYAELGTMLQLVTDTQSATKKQLALAKHLQQLRQQCESVENELNAQRTRTSSMLPKLIAKQKRIETRKVTSRKMNLYCSRMGRKLFGDNYTYRCKMDDQIKEITKSIQSKTKYLKVMSSDVPELAELNVAEKTKVSSANEAASSSNGTSTAINNSGISKAIEAAVSGTPSTEKTTPFSAAEDNLRICVKNSAVDDSIPDRVVQQMEGAVLVTEDGTRTPDDDGSATNKYRSPLEHMQNNSGCSTGQSPTDRNAIVCPFDLMGTCDDEKCAYRHLT